MHGGSRDTLCRCYPEGVRLVPAAGRSVQQDQRPWDQAGNQRFNAGYLTPRGNRIAHGARGIEAESLFSL